MIFIQWIELNKMTNRLKLDEGSVYCKRNIVRAKDIEYGSSRNGEKGRNVRIICKEKREREICKRIKVKGKPNISMVSRLRNEKDDRKRSWQ